jgi:hypothetical protein
MHNRHHNDSKQNGAKTQSNEQAAETKRREQNTLHPATRNEIWGDHSAEIFTHESSRPATAEHGSQIRRILMKFDGIGPVQILKSVNFGI